tara:strand:+ start:14334 stop:15563 length:1230 start_codon:yes stop_codon:yes gene_type:complete
MNAYFYGLMSLGLAIGLMSFIPIYTNKLKISHVIPLLVFGMLLYFANVPFPWPNPLWPLETGKIIAEIIVIISLMVAGLKVGTNYKLSHWKIPFRLISITMILSMIVVFLISFYILNLNAPVSLLLAAVLSPTDPVLASELQLEDHQNIENKDTGIRFVLTSEAGINDGLAFPFIFFAIIWSKADNFMAIDFTELIGFYFIYKIIIGILVGAIIGLSTSYLLQKFKVKKLKQITNGFLALALTLFSYGVAELAQSYGFLAVFATGITIQYFDRGSKEANKSSLLNFIEETEKLLSLLWTIFFGGAVVSGILSYADWRGIAFSLVFVLLIRPITGMAALFKTRYGLEKRLAISFFGIKGIGSFFYLTFALLNGQFTGYESLFGIVSYVVLFSIIIHGLFSIRAIEYFKLK